MCDKLGLGEFKIFQMLQVKNILLLNSDCPNIRILFESLDKLIFFFDTICYCTTVQIYKAV